MYFACVFLKAKGDLLREEISALIHKSCEIICKKAQLNYEGLRNLFIQIYSAEKKQWIGSIYNNFSRAY